LNPFPDVIRPGNPGWRLRYYKHLLGMTDAVLIRTVCRDYVYGMAWSLAYHMQISVRDDWYYPYAYAPTAFDLMNYVLVQNLDEKKTGRVMSPAPVDKTSPFSTHRPRYSPEVQLLIALPPQSFDAHVRSPVARTLSSDVSAGCAHFYPVDFRVITYLKSYISECHPMLPDIDVNRLDARLYGAARNNT